MQRRCRPRRWSRRSLSSACVAPNCPPIVVDESAVAKDPDTIKWSWDDKAANPPNGEWYVRNDASGKCVAMPAAKVRALDLEGDSKGALINHRPHYVSHLPTITILRGNAEPVDAYASAKDCAGDMKLGAQAYRRAADGVIAQDRAMLEAGANAAAYRKTRGRTEDDWTWGDAASTPPNGMWYVAEHDIGRCLPMLAGLVRDTESYWKNLGQDSLRGYGPSGFAAIVILQGGDKRMAAYASGSDCAMSVANGW
jgi:hypothetical protein